MSSARPHPEETVRPSLVQGNLAQIETADGTCLKFDPTLGYFYRTPGPSARHLAGDGSWQQFPIAMDLRNGTKCRFFLPGAALLLPSPVTALEWQDPGRRITTLEEVSMQFLLSYYRDEL